MKWTRLQLNKLPIIAIQADKALEKLEQLLHRVNLHAHHEDITQLNLLRSAILTRIDALDRFYEQNYLDSTISIFHMVKLKLKKAIFKIPNIYNETISIQIMSQDYGRQIEAEGIPKISGQHFTPAAQQSGGKGNNFRIQMKPNSKSKSKTKLKGKDNILKLLETSRRDEEQETNLMEDVQIGRPHFFDSFHETHNEQDDPLFKSSSQACNQISKESKNSIKRTANSKTEKSVSPFAKKQANSQIEANENLRNSPLKPKTPVLGTLGKNKTFQKPTYSTGGNAKLNSDKKIMTSHKVLPKKQIPRRLKTQEQQIRIMEEEKIKQQGDQFRFTIKMTKQEYAGLLKMKEMLKNGKMT